MVSPAKIVGPIRLPLKIDSVVPVYTLHYYKFGDKRWLSAVLGDIDDEPVPLRIESACTFGHILNSVKCDCGFQLDEAFRRFSHYSKGCLIYAIDDDARGLGLEAHFQIYNMRQNKNMDTDEVFAQLNSPIDSRNYDPVDFILNYLGIKNISLLSNNNARLQFLISRGYNAVFEPLEMELNRYNMATLMLEKEDLGYRWSFKTHRDWLEPIQEKVKDDLKIRAGRIVFDNKEIIAEALVEEWEVASSLINQLKGTDYAGDRFIVYLTDFPRADEIEKYATLGVYFIVVPFPKIPKELQCIAKVNGVFIQDWARSNRYKIERPQWRLINRNGVDTYKLNNEIRHIKDGAEIVDSGTIMK